MRAPYLGRVVAVEVKVGTTFKPADLEREEGGVTFVCYEKVTSLLLFCMVSNQTDGADMLLKRSTPWQGGAVVPVEPSAVRPPPPRTPFRLDPGTSIDVWQPDSACWASGTVAGPGRRGYCWILREGELPKYSIE